MSIIPKHMMSEENIKLQFITPAITSKSLNHTTLKKAVFLCSVVLVLANAIKQ